MEQVVYPGWETVKNIGKGSFGSVYEIQKNHFGTIERAALKVITVPTDLSEVETLYENNYDAESIDTYYQNCVADVVREYRFMSELKGHSNIVCCDDLSYEKHTNDPGWDIFIRMELLTPLPKYKLPDDPEAVALRLGMDICRALMLCGQKNIIHRDIKPQNIFVSDNGDFKLGDFGIAKTLEKTSGGTRIGTFSYMAPEVYNNHPYNASVDIYSLGLVMYWLLNERRLPFLDASAKPSHADIESACRKRLLGEAIPEPKNGSRELRRIVLKACEFYPGGRYHTPQEMLHDLDTLNQNKTGCHIATGIPENKPDDRSNKAGELDKRLSTVIAVASACTAALCLCMVLFVLLRRENLPEQKNSAFSSAAPTTELSIPEVEISSLPADGENDAALSTEVSTQTVSLSSMRIVETSNEPGSSSDVAVGNWMDISCSLYYNDAFRFWVVNKPDYSNSEYVVFDISQGCVSMEGVLALEENSAPDTEVMFDFYVDNQSVYTSPAVSASSGPVSFQLDLTGGHYLKITCTTFSRQFCYGIVYANIQTA